MSRHWDYPLELSFDRFWWVLILFFFLLYAVTLLCFIFHSFELMIYTTLNHIVQLVIIVSAEYKLQNAHLLSSTVEYSFKNIPVIQQSVALFIEMFTNCVVDACFLFLLMMLLMLLLLVFLPEWYSFSIIRMCVIIIHLQMYTHSPWNVAVAPSLVRFNYTGCLVILSPILFFFSWRHLTIHFVNWL